MLGLSAELSCFPSFNLRWTSFAPGLDRVVLALHRTFLQRSGGKQSVYAPLVPVLTQLMLHFIDEWEVFALLSHLSHHTAWLDCSRESSIASQSTLISLLHSHAVSSHGIAICWSCKPISWPSQDIGTHMILCTECKVFWAQTDLVTKVNNWKGANVWEPITVHLLLGINLRGIRAIKTGRHDTRVVLGWTH